MYLRLYILIFSALISVGIRESFAEDAKESAKTSQKTPTEDIYIDDINTEVEGSGNGAREVKDDLEASGSGFGPDDEDGDGSPGDNQVNKVPQSLPPTKPPITSSEDTRKINSVGGTKNDWTPPNFGDDEIQPESDLNNNITPRDRDKEVYMNPKHEDRATSFFAQPGILAAVIGGAVVGLLCAILVVMFIVYRMRKKDEGSYALDEPKRSPTSNSYSKNSNREFYA